MNFFDFLMGGVSHNLWYTIPLSQICVRLRREITHKEYVHTSTLNNVELLSPPPFFKGNRPTVWDKKYLKTA